MNRQLRELVWQRAGDRCEYCQMPQEFAEASHEIDHVIAEKHAGPTVAENLALACFGCNNHKGPNVAGIDRLNGAVTRLFHPRQDHWESHFRWERAVLVGLTAIGRVTVEVLDINARHRILHREALRDEGVFPPEQTAG